MNTQPMATAGQQRLSVWDPDNPTSTAAATGGRGGDDAAAGGRGGRGGVVVAVGLVRSSAVTLPRHARESSSFPVSSDDMLLSGVLVGNGALWPRAGR